MKRHVTCTTSERGFFGLQDIAQGLLVLMILLPTIFGLVRIGMDAFAKSQAAKHLAQVSVAASAYAKKHYDLLLSQSSASNGPTVNVSTLINEQFLPQGFRDRNVWGQSYIAYFRKPTPNALQTLVLTTGGRGYEARDPSFANVLVPSAATMLSGSGGSGGFVPTGALSGQSSDMLQGAYGGWTISLSSLGIPSPGAGHLGAIANFDATSLAQDFLYRVAVPGQPELNAMQTELDMTDHAIRKVKEVQFTPRVLDAETCTPDDEGRIFLDINQGLYLCRNNHFEVVADTGNAALLKTAQLAVDGQIIQKPVCPTNTDTVPQIYVAPALAAAGNDAPPMTALQAWAVDLNATEWQVHLRLLTTDDSLGIIDASGDRWVYPAPDYGRITIFATCDRDRSTPVVTP